jgi:hypothetical protein
MGTVVRFVVRLPARLVHVDVDQAAARPVPGTEVAIDEADVIGFVLGYAAAFGVDTPRAVDGPVPERHRRMQLLRSAQTAGLLTYLGVEDDVCLRVDRDDATTPLADPEPVGLPAPTGTDGGAEPDWEKGPTP